SLFQGACPAQQLCCQYRMAGHSEKDQNPYQQDCERSRDRPWPQKDSRRGDSFPPVRKKACAARRGRQSTNNCRLYFGIPGTHNRGVLIERVNRRPGIAEAHGQLDRSAFAESDRRPLSHGAVRRSLDAHERESNLLLAKDLDEADLLPGVYVQGLFAHLGAYSLLSQNETIDR